MTYQQALKKAETVGAGKAEAEAHLAQTCRTLACIHAIDPALVYEGAIKQGIDARSLVKLADADPVGLGDLMFV
jgi:hypothetical protein